MYSNHKQSHWLWVCAFVVAKVIGPIIGGSRNNIREGMNKAKCLSCGTDMGSFFGLIREALHGLILTNRPDILQCTGSILHFGLGNFS